MDILIFERRHSNGAVACVHRDTEGAGYLPSASPRDEERDEDAWPYTDTIDDAQATADAMAHAGCIGAACGLWVTISRSGPIE